MKCTFCGSHIDPSEQRCPSCGYPRTGKAAGSDRSRSSFFLFLTLAVVVLALIISGIVMFRLPEATAPVILNPQATFPSVVPTEPSQPAPESSTTPPAVVTADYFRVTDGILEFLPDKYTGGPILDVPARVGNQQVIGLADNAFRNCDMLSTITLPEGLLTIGNGAFADCDKLRGIYFPDGVVTVGNQALMNCPDLEAVYIAGSIVSIGESTFDECPKLRFIFFNGYVEDWSELYWEYITPFTYVVCLDGDLRHGAEMP